MDRQPNNSDKVGQARKELIASGFEKIKEAEEKGFYLEGLTILESLISDRLESLKSQIKLRNSEDGIITSKFENLGSLINFLKEKEELNQDFRSFLKNEMTVWKNRRNKALHQMVKLEKDNLHEWTVRYNSFRPDIEEGREIFRRINREIYAFKK